MGEGGSGSSREDFEGGGKGRDFPSFCSSLFFGGIGGEKE